MADRLVGEASSAAHFFPLALAEQSRLAVIDLLNETERLKVAQQPEQAIARYRASLLNSRSVLDYAISFNLAVTLADVKDTAGAEEAYRQTLRFKADFIPAHLNLGTLLESLGRQDEALGQWREVLRLDNASLACERLLHLQALNNLGRLLEISRQFDEAEQMLLQSLTLDSKQPHALQHWIHLRQKQCKWPVFGDLGAIQTEQMQLSCSALSTLSLFDDPAIQLAAARRLISDKLSISRPSPLCRDAYSHTRLRIGYLSSDFCLHPVALLTVELFELHDRNTVEIYGFCSGSDDGSALRSRVIRAMDHFVRIADMDDEAAARTIRACEIDILIDLQGLTSGVRPNIFSYRPAPIQVTWLGYPGTTAHPAIDYIIGDAFVFSGNLQAFLTEKPILMPACFQASDRQREIGKLPGRSDYRLPDDAFVYCSFNNSYKLTPEVFAAWMRILLRVPNSVLWLLADNPWVKENLQKSAEQQGVTSTRLIFADRVAPPDYLARYKLADLFLDTRPYNAGTTANDALWMGLPVLTCSGRSFVSRMAGSLLSTVGLPELITDDLRDYENKAVGLANEPWKMAALRQHLEQTRSDSRLFDMDRFTTDLESLYTQLSRHPLVGASMASDKDRCELGRVFLHVGCSTKTKKDTLPIFNSDSWSEIRLDVDASVSPDVLGSMTDMRAVADASVDAVFSSHNLEHLYPHEIQIALHEFLRVLKPDGVAIVTCPDLQSVCALVAANKLTEVAYQSPSGPITPLDILYGHRASIKNGNFFMAHRCGFTKDSLTAELQAAEFGTVGVLARPENLDLWAVASKKALNQEQFSNLVQKMLA